ncbi:MAG: hypothetical protein WCK77_08580 [Verrucomicrobiota bacterium]
MKTTALTIGAVALLSQGRALALADAGSSSSGQKLVKIRRVWSMQSDGVSGSGSATNEFDDNILCALATQNLLKNLATGGHITRTLTVRENQWVPSSWVLNEFLKVADGEAEPGPLVIFDDPFYSYPDCEFVDGVRQFPICTVSGRVVAGQSTLTLRWIWGPPA